MRLTLLLATLLWLGAGESRAADRSHALVVTFDVPEERAPDWVCVLTDVSCDDPANCYMKRLDTINRLLESNEPGRYGVRDDALARMPPPHKTASSNAQDGLLPRAIAALVRDSKPGTCAQEDSVGCRPELDLRHFLGALPSPDLPRPLTGNIVCQTRQGAEVAARHADARAPAAVRERVAFISLGFPDAYKRPSGIQQINFVGTSANIVFEQALSTTTITFVQVLGGDYAASESSAVGSNESVVVKLHPRCQRVLAELPAHVSPITGVELHSPSLDAKAAHHQARPSRVPRAPPTAELPGDALTCTPAHTGTRTLAIEVPYTTTGEEKTLTVDYAASGGATRSEVRWTEALPPLPLRLGVRSIRFTWQRPLGCLAERWSDATRLPQTEWNASCPRATLADTTVCSVVSPDVEHLAACEYRCVIADNLDALRLPVPVQFDRIRTHPDRDAEDILYSWRDQLHFEGQQLTSVVAPIDRRVVLEFRDRSPWADHRGDALDAIRVVSGHGSAQLDLTDGKGPPAWVSLATPGRTCTDRLRVAVFGTRSYLEKTFEATGGQIAMTKPDDYDRQMLRAYGLLGVGATFRDLPINGSVQGELGIGAQRALRGAWSIDVEASGQLTQTYYAGIELPKTHPAGLRGVPYLRFDLRAGPEWWWKRRFGAALLAGLGLGTPVQFKNDRLVGILRFSIVIEGQVSFTMLPRRLWLIVGGGPRLFEEHMDYTTDFLSSPTVNLDHSRQWYGFLRLRVAL